MRLSKQTSTSAVYFLTGELPVEAIIHRDILSLFYSVWINPQSKIYTIIKYLLTNITSKSKTWTNFLRHICKQYGIEDPHILISRDPPTKLTFKADTEARIRSFHEHELRNKAQFNKKLKYFNVSLLGLSGRPHPAISGLFTASEVEKSGAHIKMLVGDYYTMEVKSEHSGGSPHCQLCHLNAESGEKIENVENLCHILVFCGAYQEQRSKILHEMSVTCQQTVNNVNISEYFNNPELLTQFILDPSSINLPLRVNTNDPVLPVLFKLSRDFCYFINKQRIKLLNKD